MAFIFDDSTALLIKFIKPSKLELEKKSQVIVSVKKITI